MRILLITSAYNSLTQRVHAELTDRGHEVSVELAVADEVMREGVRRFDPDLVIAPMLTTAIPVDIWTARPCFIIHPGPKGDRGPSSLDWAIMGGAGGLQSSRRHRRAASALPAAASQDRLAGRVHVLGSGEAAGGRLQPRCPGCDRRRRVLPVRWAQRRRLAR